MSAAERAELESEQSYVDRVYARLDELVRSATAAERDGRARGMLDYTGEIKEEDYRTLYERDVMVDHAVRRLAVLDAQREGLVFGRLDQHDGAIRYVGRIGIRDSEQEPLVIDWRAPAAAVFYQATPVRPMGVIRRRVLRTKGQQVTGLEDDLLDPDAASDELTVVGDGALMAALNAARGPQMRDIVSTIQKEQDEIIRAPGDGATLIRGGPGTGKTVVALHRTAYLLYTDRRRISRGGVLVVGPSPVFMSYIDRVLPSLGENDATLRAIGQVMDGISADRSDSYDVAVVKGGSRMRTLLTRAAKDAVPGAAREFRSYLSGRTLRVGEAELAEIRRTVLRRGARHNPARREAVRGLQNALWVAADGERAGLSREDFDADLLDSEEFVEFVETWWPALSATDVFERLRDREFLILCGKGILRKPELDLLANSLAGSTGYSVEDVPLLDELHALLGEPPPPLRVEDPFDELSALDDSEVSELRTYGEPGSRRSGTPAEHSEQYDGYTHILVDESQDLSPMQWRMLGRRGQRASWTIVGDPAQSSWPDEAEAVKARDLALGKRRRCAFQLSTNYRNSAEIFELAAQVIRREVLGPDLPNAVRQTGIEPEHVLVREPGLPDAVREAVRRMLEIVSGSVGVVARADRLDKVNGWLGDADEPVDDRVVVLSGLATKGLEFDAVVVVEPGDILYENPVGLRTLYVVLTRATQRLVTVGTDDGWEDEPDMVPDHDQPPSDWVAETLF